jgi:phage terminase large subunit-like protein
MDSSSAAPPDVPRRWRDLFALIPGYDPVKTAGECTFDAGLADRCVAFFEKHLTHIEGKWAGKPLSLEPWQQAIVGCAFGWFRPDGTRRYREVFQYVPRKNGKSTMLGGLVNLVAFCDDEPGAQIYSAAADREQATLVYRQAKGMILNNPALSRHARIYATYKSIEFPNGVVYKALSADADTKHGQNTHLVVIDELHAQPNRDLVDVLVTSTGSRTQPLIWYITTADFDRESICNEKYDYASKVRDGIVADAAFLPVIFEATTDDDWTSPKTWRKANPNLGVSVSEEYLARECQRAKETPTYENTFKRLHLNIRTQNDVRWLRLEDWDGCAGPVNETALAGRHCFGALDLSSKVDVTAWVLVFPPTDDDPLWRILPRFFIPADNARQRERRDRVPYETWGRQGLMTLTEGNVVDYDVVKAQIAADAKTFDLQEVAYDPWNATQIALQLQADGATVVEFGQGYRSMSEPTKELEKLVTSGRLAHAGNPVLRWMAGNAAVESDPAGNLKPSKKKSTERIDGVVALVMGLGRAIMKPDETSVYESRGVLHF